MTPPEILSRAFLVVIVGLIVGFLLPGFVYHKGDVFYHEDVEKYLPAEPLNKLNEYKALQDKRQHKIEQLSNYLVDLPENVGDKEQVGNTLELLEHLKKTQNIDKPPIKAIGYYFSRIMFLWPSIYICLGILIYVIPPLSINSKKTFKDIINIFLIFIIIVPLHRWPTWCRNYFFYSESEGRVIFAYANLDIFPFGFYLQEGMALVICLLLAIIWSQWLNYFLQCRNELDTLCKNACKEIFDPIHTLRISKRFYHWQATSVILCLGFIWYTQFFWYNEVIVSDQRYIVHAIVVHAFWGVTWLIVSLPLMITWYNWHVIRNKAISIFGEQASPESERKLMALKDLKPIGSLNITASSFLALLSFFYPVVKSLIK